MLAVGWEAPPELHIASLGEEDTEKGFVLRSGHFYLKYVLRQSCISRENSLTCWPLAHRAASWAAYQCYVSQPWPQKYLWKVTFPGGHWSCSICVLKARRALLLVSMPLTRLQGFSKVIHKSCGAQGEVLSSSPQHFCLSCRPDAFHKGSVPCTKTYLFIYPWLIPKDALL